MSPETLFQLCGSVAAAGWLLLALFPRRPWANRLLAGGVLPVLLGLVYLSLLAAKGPSSKGGFGSLAQVAQLFSEPWLLLAGWVHYLAFDLFIGSWEARAAERAGVPHLVLLPCLLLTFLVGPVGLLAFLAVRAVYLRRAAL